MSVRMLMDPETQLGADLYKVLNVDPSADAEVIRAAYRALARRDHPDVSADPAAAAKMAELNAAFEVLGDPDSRYEYDRARKALAVQTAEAPAAVATPRAQPLATRVAAQAHAAAVPDQAGTVLEFGRYAGWSLAALARHDPTYLEWLARTMIGRTYAEEIDKLLAPQRPRPLTVANPARDRKGLFGRILG